MQSQHPDLNLPFAVFWESLWKFLPETVLLLSPDGKIILNNAGNAFGKMVVELNVNTIGDALPEELREGAKKLLLEVSRTGQKGETDFYFIYQKLKFRFFARIIPVIGYEKRFLLVLCRDKSTSEKAAHEITRAMLKGEIRERSRIASELHDGVGQYLSAAKINFENLSRKLDISSSRELQKQAETVESMLVSAIQEIRHISHNLSPYSLRDFGVVSALKQMSDRVSQEGALIVVFNEYDLKAELDITIQATLFRIVQELLNNTLKHSFASRVDIQMSEQAGFITLTYEDNGIGFDPEEAVNRGAGLQNIYHRTATLEGTVTIESGAGKGTLVILEFPVN